jgi:hypothetical protein
MLNKLKHIAFHFALLSSLIAAPAFAGTLIGQTFDASVAITGEDDNGFYAVDVLTGPITPTPSGVTYVVPVFKQLTFDTFSTPSNQIDGTVSITFTDNTVSVNMSGQVQPFELESKFTAISGPITSDVDTASGAQPGVSMDLFHSFTSKALDFASYYLGYQTGTDLTQTQTLTFGVPVPEPGDWILMLAGLFGVGGLLRARAARSVAPDV